MNSVAVSSPAGIPLAGQPDDSTTAYYAIRFNGTSGVQDVVHRFETALTVNAGSAFREIAPDLCGNVYMLTPTPSFSLPSNVSLNIRKYDAAGDEL